MSTDFKRLSSIALSLSLLVSFSYSNCLNSYYLKAEADTSQSDTVENGGYYEISEREYALCKELFQKAYDGLDSLPPSESFETAKVWFKDGLDACDTISENYKPQNGVYRIPSGSEEAQAFGYGKDGLLVCFLDEEWLLEELEKLDGLDWEFPEALSDEELKVLKKNIDKKQKEYDEAKKQAPPPSDPLIIHFSSEEKIILTNIEDGVNFDLDNNGFAEKTSWVGPEEGLLAIDLNNNGTIDNGGELFGDRFKMPNGNISTDGKYEQQ